MIQDILDRLATTAPSLKLIGDAAAFAAIKGNPPRHKQPAAYVVPLSETARPNQAMNALSQSVTLSFGVLLAMSDLSDGRGGAASKRVEEVRDEVKLALAGWKPARAQRRIEYAGGRMLGLNGGVVWWQSDFTALTLLRNT